MVFEKNEPVHSKLKVLAALESDKSQRSLTPDILYTELIQKTVIKKEKL